MEAREKVSQQLFAEPRDILPLHECIRHTFDLKDDFPVSEGLLRARNKTVIERDIWRYLPSWIQREALVWRDALFECAIENYVNCEHMGTPRGRLLANLIAGDRENWDMRASLCAKAWLFAWAKSQDEFN